MFKVYTIDGSDKSQSYKYLPVGAITPKVGLALKWDTSNGVLILAPTTSQAKPDYICMHEEAAAVSSGTVVACLPVTDDMVFETVFSADGSNVKVGTKVTIASDGLRVTATPSNGVAQIVEKPDPGAAGDRVRVRFK
jgi:hypothetical protein